MSPAPPAVSLCALLSSALWLGALWSGAPACLAQDATVPRSPPPAPADDPASANTKPADDHGTVQLPPTGGERRTADRADAAETEKRITELTNEFRKKEGLKPVSRDERLAGAAAKFGEYLAEQGVLGHRAGGTTPSQRVKAAGYDYCSVRENLAYQFDTFGFAAEKLAEQCVTGWIDSPGHRANLVADDVTQTGVGVVYDPRSGRYFAVQLFALPADAAVTFEVENRTTAPRTYRVGGRDYTLPPRYVQTHTRCTPDAVTVTLDPAPPADAKPANAKPANAKPNKTGKPLQIAGGQVLILRPGADGEVDPEVWTPPKEPGNPPGRTGGAR